MPDETPAVLSDGDLLAAIRVADAEILLALPGTRPEDQPDAAAGEAMARARKAVSVALSAAPWPPDPPLPPGQFVRVELPGYRQHTGWMTEETRAGAGVLVIRDWNGAVQAEVFPGAGCQVVHLPTPLKRPDPGAPRAITAGDGFEPDYDGPF